MSKRRRDILNAAREMLAEDGYERFTIRNLAARSNVTAPTIYNLIGGKADVIDALIEEMMTRINSAELFQAGADPIEAAELMMDRLAESYHQEPAYYRAAFLAWEFQQHFQNSQPAGMSSASMHSVASVIDAAHSAGMLREDANLDLLRLHIWNCYRIARHDWIHGHISLDRFRFQGLTAILFYLLGIVHEDHRSRILDSIEKATRRVRALEPSRLTDKDAHTG